MAMAPTEMVSMPGRMMTTAPTKAKKMPPSRRWLKVSPRNTNAPMVMKTGAVKLNAVRSARVILVTA